jgi:hypothetical protein
VRVDAAKVSAKSTIAQCLAALSQPPVRTIRFRTLPYNNPVALIDLPCNAFPVASMSDIADVVSNKAEDTASQVHDRTELRAGLHCNSAKA